MSTAITETAPSFTLPGVDGRDHSLDDYRDAEALVLVQSCNHCPYVQAWEGRLSAMQQEYGDRGVRIVAISSNDVSSHPEDSFEQMQVRAQEQGFTLDYLYDESQDVARTIAAEAIISDTTRSPAPLHHLGWKGMSVTPDIGARMTGSSIRTGPMAKGGSRRFEQSMSTDQFIGILCSAQ